MGPSDYSDAIRPLFFKNGKHIPLTIAALGLAGEAGEVTGAFEEFAEEIPSVSTPEQADDLSKRFSEKLTLELGDTLWYVAAILDTFGLDCSDVDDLLADFDGLEELHSQLAGFNPARLTAALSMHAGLAADLIKKSEWHGKTLDADELFATLGNVVVVVGEIASRVQVGLGEVCAANVAKLAKRYPGGFVEGGGVR